MRPLKLEVKSFTSFREPQQLDFTELDVFAVAGPTGSGKSSILDAMTYALYGRVERVGDGVRQLISQGHPRMAVSLEFAVGTERFRITRSTPAKGATKILLERQGADGEWRQAGDGADRVKDTDRRVASMIGLSYDGFTRSVLLPQGKFAEFLVGDPKKRREILTELLGLSLFRRMAERAGTVAKEAALRAQTITDVLSGEFAGASAEALRDANRIVKQAEKREKLLGKAAEKVLDILSRWHDAERSLDELRRCLDEVDRNCEVLKEVTDELPRCVHQIADSTAGLRKRRAELSATEKAAKKALGALHQAEQQVGLRDELVKAQRFAHEVEMALETIDTKAAELQGAKQTATGLREALHKAERDLKSRSKALSALDLEFAEAQEALEKARHGDLVVAVSTGLKAGDPCPVCGTTLAAAPKRSAAGGVRTATKTVERLRTAVERGRQSVRDAERLRDAADAKLQINLAAQEQLTAELTDLKRSVAAAEKALGAVLGTPLPPDPVKAVEARSAELRALERACADAAARESQAREALLLAERDLERVTSHVDRLRDRIVSDRGSLFETVARLLDEPKPRWRVPVVPSSSDVTKLHEYAASLVNALEAMARKLSATLDERSSFERSLLEEANEVVAGLVEPERELKALASSINSECRRASAAVAAQTQRASEIATRVERKQQLDKDVKELNSRATVFKALAHELRADRLIAFLQAEALQILAAAGSARLAALSDGRYRLAFRDDEFFVVDTWNGDDERSVRTLSGGETFLASLALALALADQVRSLSVTDRARLDSLFLDEGFGTLDQETLRTVVGAIEQLAGDGRMVGVITHVPELAEQFPRVQVQKSQRGSRLEVLTV